MRGAVLRAYSGDWCEREAPSVEAPIRSGFTFRDDVCGDLELIACESGLEGSSYGLRGEDVVAVQGWNDTGGPWTWGDPAAFEEFRRCQREAP